MICVQMVEDDTRESAFKTAQGFGAGISGFDSLAVIRPAEAVETDLGDRDAMQSSVELPVA